MASKIKVDTLETANGSGTIALSNQLSGMTTASLPTLTSAEMPSGSVLQIVNVQNGAIVTGTTTIDYDDGIPQNTEGDEYMTLAITPSNTNNLLKIEVTTMASNSSVNHMITLLFQDTTTSALAAITAYQGVATGSVAVSFTHYMTAGTTSATTFKVRVGGEGAGTTSFNGQNTARRFGGTMASSITITEVAA